MAHQAYVVLGSNDNPAHHLRQAVRALRRRCTVRAVSPVYASPATHGDGTTYLNAAVCIATDLPPLAFKQTVLQAIERELGRVRRPGQPVCIDLDLALWDETSLDYGNKPWHVPHADVLRRAFVARPLADLAPEYVHPEDGRTLAAIADALPADALTRRDDVSLAW